MYGDGAVETLLGRALADRRDRVFLVSKVLPENATRRGVVQASYDALSGLHEWSTAAIEEALRVGLIEGMELKPRVAFGPVRVAVTGRRISPPLFESLELLGRERSLARLQSALA